VSKPSSDSDEDIHIEFTYDANGFRNSVKDGRDHITSFGYDVDYAGDPIPDSRGMLTRVISPPPGLGENPLVTLYEYDSKNNLVQIVPPKGVGNGSSVDAGTDLSGVIDTDYATDLAYDAATETKLVAVTRKYTDPDLGLLTAVTTLEYSDAANPGLVTRVIPPRGNTSAVPDSNYATTFAYFGSGAKTGLLERVIDPLGNQSSFDYDAAGRRVSIVDPNGSALGAGSFSLQLGTARSQPGRLRLGSSGANPAAHTWRTEYDDEDRVRFLHAPRQWPVGVSSRPNSASTRWAIASWSSTPTGR
jgi:YD repeat-containing protein